MIPEDFSLGLNEWWQISENVAVLVIPASMLEVLRWAAFLLVVKALQRHPDRLN